MHVWCIVLERKPTSSHVPSYVHASGLDISAASVVVRYDDALVKASGRGSLTHCVPWQVYRRLPLLSTSPAIIRFFIASRCIAKPFLEHPVMCYFEQTRWTCGYWKWGNFRQQCTKEYRTGETCGLKLIYTTDLEPGQCRICDQIDKKDRRVRKMAADISRWRREGGRTATIEKTERDIGEIQMQIAGLQATHDERVRAVN
jgi:hypothetical protein